MNTEVPIEEIQRKLKEIENKDIEELYSEIDGTYSTIFIIGYKFGKTEAFKELLKEE